MKEKLLAIKNGVFFSFVLPEVKLCFDILTSQFDRCCRKIQGHVESVVSDAHSTEIKHK